MQQLQPCQPVQPGGHLLCCMQPSVFLHQRLAFKMAATCYAAMHPCRLLRENRQRMNFADLDDERCNPLLIEPQPEPSTSGWSSSHAGQRGCPVYVMLPLDTVWVVPRDGKTVSVLKKERSLEIALHTLKQAS